MSIVSDSKWADQVHINEIHWYLWDFWMLNIIRSLQIHRLSLKRMSYQILSCLFQSLTIILPLNELHYYVHDLHDFHAKCIFVATWASGILSWSFTILKMMTWESKVKPNVTFSILCLLLALWWMFYDTSWRYRCYLKVPNGCCVPLSDLH